jgi:hypothetical protein
LPSGVKRIEVLRPPVVATSQPSWSRAWRAKALRSLISQPQSRVVSTKTYDAAGFCSFRRHDQLQGVGSQLEGVGHADVDVHTSQDFADLAAREQPREFAWDLPGREGEAGEVVRQVVLEHPSRMADVGMFLPKFVHR